MIGAGGFIGEVSIVTTDRADADVELTDLFVHPLRRGRGWASDLVDAALAFCSRKGWSVILRARPHGRERLSRPALVRFYAAKGFVSTDDDDQSELWMLLVNDSAHVTKSGLRHKEEVRP